MRKDSNPILWDKEALTDIYTNIGYGQDRIAEILSVSHSTVAEAIKRFNLQKPIKYADQKFVGGKGGKCLPDGTRRTQTSGYIKIKVNGVWVLEHRYIMSRKIGRTLLKTEHVHHLNSIKDDNREDNLEVLSPSKHGIATFTCQNCTLLKEIRLLQWQIKELQKQLQGQFKF